MELLVSAGFTLFGSVVAFYAAIISFFILLVILENIDNGFGSFLTLAVFLVLTYFWSTLPFSEIFTLLNIGVYIGAGFIYALIKTYFKGRELEDVAKKCFDLKYAVFRWWSLWPVSLVNWIFGRLLKDLYDWVYMKVAKIFEALFGMPKEEKPPHETFND